MKEENTPSRVGQVRATMKGPIYEGKDGHRRMVVGQPEGRVAWIRIEPDGTFGRAGKCSRSTWHNWVKARITKGNGYRDSLAPRISTSCQGQKRKRGRLVWTCVSDLNGNIRAVAAGNRKADLTHAEWREWGDLCRAGR